MTNKQMEELIKEKEAMVHNKLIEECKECKIGSYWDYVEEFINPFLPDNKKIKKGDYWSKDKPFAELDWANINHLES